jgi:signal transduction histidine kinase/CheY-like chemotaxis protein
VQVSCRIDILNSLDIQIPTPVLLLDKEFMIVDFNEAAQQAFPILRAEEPKRLEALIHGDDWSLVQSELDGFDGSIRFRCRLFSGSSKDSRWYDFRCACSEEKAGLICVIFDIHEEVLNGQTISKEKADAYIRMEQAQLARNKFLDIMSHELRTPLTAILGLSEALDTGLYGACTDEQKDAIRTIFECGTNLLRLINDILDVTKLETGKLQIHAEPLSAREVCKSVSRQHSQAAKERNVVLSTESPDILFLGDRRRLKQALSHLVENAIKFSPHGKKVTLAVTFDSLDVTFSVLDQGPGIPVDELPSLLLPFRQFDQTLARHYNGAGLGLTLSQKLMDLMGGRLEVRNRQEGGACFSLVLPEAYFEQKRKDAPVHVKGEGTVLIVDDHQATVKLLRDALIAWGFDVETFEDVRSLQARSKDSPATAVLMDGKLPDGSGIDCIAWLREQSEYKDLPIVFLTASEGLELKQAGMAAGASAYLEKPVRLAEIAHCLEYLLEPGPD